MVFNFYTITSFINFLTSIILAVFVLLKNKKGPKNIAFFIMAGFIGFWSLAYFMWHNSMDSYVASFFWLQIVGALIIMIPPSYLHFVLAVTETLDKKKVLLAGVYIFFYAFVLLDVKGYFITTIAPVMDFKYWPMASPVFSLWLFCFTVCVIYSSYLLIKKYKASFGAAKIQIKYIAFGMIFGFLFGSSNFLPWYKINIHPYGNALVPIYVISITYAITRYKFMNIKVVVRNVLFYLGISSVLYAVFYGIAFFYQTVFGGVFTSGAYFTGVFVAPLVAVILYGVSNSLSFFFSKYFFPSMYAYQASLKKASYSLSRSRDKNKIAGIIATAIKETIQPEKVAVLLAQNKEKSFKIAENSGFDANNIALLDYKLFSDYFKKNAEMLTKESIDELIEKTQSQREKTLLYKVETQLHESGISVCVPLKSSTGLLGIIITDYKQYEPAYLQEDFDLLESLSQDSEIVLENSVLYEQIKKENQKLKKTS